MHSELLQPTQLHLSKSSLAVVKLVNNKFEFFLFISAVQEKGRPTGTAMCSACVAAAAACTDRQYVAHQCSALPLLKTHAVLMHKLQLLPAAVL